MAKDITASISTQSSEGMLFSSHHFLFLGEVASISQSDNNIVGIGKHLCGGATDLSYRCLMEVDMSSRTCAS